MYVVSALVCAFMDGISVDPSQGSVCWRQTVPLPRWRGQRWAQHPVSAWRTLRRRLCLWQSCWAPDWAKLQPPLGRPRLWQRPNKVHTQRNCASVTFPAEAVWQMQRGTVVCAGANTSSDIILMAPDKLFAGFTQTLLQWSAGWDDKWFRWPLDICQCLKERHQEPHYKEDRDKKRNRRGGLKLKKSLNV